MKAKLCLVGFVALCGLLVAGALWHTQLGRWVDTVRVRVQASRVQTAPQAPAKKPIGLDEIDPDKERLDRIAAQLEHCRGYIDVDLIFSLVADEIRGRRAAQEADK